jgi:hypothetical protein
MFDLSGMMKGVDFKCQTIHRDIYVYLTEFPEISLLICFQFIQQLHKFCITLHCDNIIFVHQAVEALLLRICRSIATTIGYGVLVSIWLLVGIF